MYVSFKHLIAHIQSPYPLLKDSITKYIEKTLEKATALLIYSLRIPIARLYTTQSDDPSH